MNPYLPDDYKQALYALLPVGSAWPREDSIISKNASFLSLLVQKIDVGACNLLKDVFPATADSLLDEWMLSCGVPDSYLGSPSTKNEIRAQVVAKIIGINGQSQHYYINLAQKLGYTISIKTYTPWRCGSGRAGAKIYGKSWAYAWTIYGPEADNFLRDIFYKLKPAHTSLTPIG